MSHSRLLALVLEHKKDLIADQAEITRQVLQAKNLADIVSYDQLIREISSSAEDGTLKEKLELFAGTLSGNQHTQEGNILVQSGYISYQQALRLLEEDDEEKTGTLKDIQTYRRRINFAKEKGRLRVKGKKRTTAVNFEDLKALMKENMRTVNLARGEIPVKIQSYSSFDCPELEAAYQEVNGRKSKTFRNEEYLPQSFFAALFQRTEAFVGVAPLPTLRAYNKRLYGAVSGGEIPVKRPHKKLNLLHRESVEAIIKYRVQQLKDTR
jgi:hypothetical protein